MVDSAGGAYREKYRLALAEQERLEKQFKFQLDALRKTLLNVSTAAQGQDRQLDASLILLKEKMRGATGQQVLEQMEKVQAAAADFDHSRHLLGASVAKNVTLMADRLTALQIPGQLRRSLTSFSAGLKKRLKAPQDYATAIAELGQLQALALDAAENPPSTLWQRLRGGKTLKNQADLTPIHESSLKEQAQTPASSARLDRRDAEADDEADMDFSPREGEVIQAIAGVNHMESDGRFDEGDEESYHKVAQRIARTLENLVARIEPNDVVRHKIDIVQMRMQRGMDWFSLAVTLEDIRDILLLRYLQNDQDFTDYLKRVNNELRSISEALGVASQLEENNKRVADDFSSAVSDQVEIMRGSLHTSDNIEQLKQAVTEHLSTIHDALGAYKTHTAAASISITDQLRALIDRVQTVEAESEKTKELLEEERYRATHDPLTGLPNREAYNERAFHELQRFKRYCRPLTLAVCDIDRFKGINDKFGHQAGDKVLNLIAKLISTRLRTVDFVARYGGEEFVMLMPETDTAQAVAVLDKVRKLIAKTPFKFKGEPVSITISFGLASFTVEESVDNVFERADKALYRAKTLGRNQCVIADGNVQPAENPTLIKPSSPSSTGKTKK